MNIATPEAMPLSEQVFRGVVSLALLFAVLRLSYAGYLFMTSEEWKQKERARKIIGDVCLGLGLIGGATFFVSLLSKKIRGELFPGKFMLNLLSTAAYASDDGRQSLVSILPYVILGLLCVMGITFLWAVGILLMTKGPKENQARYRAANDIVKTFGGFFTGLLTALIR